MYKVLLVDDEPIVRQGLRTLINWEEYGFSVCGEASDGRDGLNKLLCLGPDIAVVDIKMPNIDGIEMVRQAHEKGYKGKALILTGYSEFQYAQHAIRVGVDGFLLKPIDEDILIEELMLLKEKLDLSMQVKTDKFYADADKLKEKLLSDMICGILPVSGNEAKILSEGMDQRSDTFRIAVIEGLLHDHRNLNSIRETVKAEKDVTVTFMDSYVILLVKSKNTAKVSGLLMQTGKNAPVRSVSNPFTAVGREIYSLDGISDSYKDAKKIIDRRFFFGQKIDIVFWEDVENTLINDGDLRKINFASHSKNIYKYIEIGNETAIHTAVRELEQDCVGNNVKPEKIHTVFISTYLKIKEMLSIQYKTVSEGMLEECEIIGTVYSIDCLQDIALYMAGEFIKVARMVCNFTQENIVKKVCSYIEKNYSKELRLRTLAEMFGYNSAYLGQIFFTRTGMSFNNYLAKVRNEMAKKLLLDKRLKVYEVSGMVGYKSTDYFYNKFKADVGMTPSEFIKDCENRTAGKEASLAPQCFQHDGSQLERV